VSRRQPLSRERIVEAALVLADRDGPDALTMRRLGRELGVEGMAVYGYFASKDELLAAVAGRVLSELELVRDPDAPWQERVRAVVRGWAGLRDRHPGGFPLLYKRRGWASEEFQPVEEILDALRGAGLRPERAVLAYHALVWMLDGILLAANYGDEPFSDGWVRGAQVVDPAAYPRLVEAAPYSAQVTPRQIFDLGAELVIAGLERLVAEQK
jgi:AcrR family transcriptional regulator